jgi:hypothetical protein
MEPESVQTRPSSLRIKEFEFFRVACHGTEMTRRRRVSLSLESPDRPGFWSQLEERGDQRVVWLSRRLTGRHRSRWFLRLRELIVQFAVAHRSDQNVDD